jgi:hypothetical protein
MTETAAPPDAGENHKAAPPQAAPEPGLSPAAPAAAAGEPCEPCTQNAERRGAAGLGLVLCGVAGALAYIGIDLLTGGGLSRMLGGGRGWDDGEEADEE